MNDRDLNSGLLAIQLERTTYPDVADVHAQLLAIPIEQIAQESSFLTPDFTGRFQSMFSATKFVVAGAIVVLFGGFLLVGQPFGQQREVPGAATGEAGTFRSAGSLAQPRSEHTATLLPDGRVLIVGGGHASAEVWDPATGSFGPAGSLAQPRSEHTATLLPDGRVLVFGTIACCESLASAEVWDPASESFSAAGAVVEATGGHAATVLLDGRVFILGHGYLAEVWDPVVSSFGDTGFLAQPRGEATATLLPDGRVLVVGGTDESHWVALASAEVWDPMTASFSPAGSLVQGRWDHSATLLPDGRVLVVGGLDVDDSENDGIDTIASAEVWDPVASSFGPAGSLARPRSEHTATLLRDGRVLVVGGTDLNSSEIWDPDTDTFGPAGRMALKRDGHSATALPDGRVLVVGGQDDGVVDASAEVWEPSGG